MFGTVTTLLSNVLIRVLLNPTFSTKPVTVPTLTTSPTVNGLSKNIVKDPSKFSRLSFDAIAIAIPPIPNPVAKAVMFMSNTFPKIKNRANMTTRILPISIANGMS